MMTERERESVRVRVRVRARARESISPFLVTLLLLAQKVAVRARNVVLRTAGLGHGFPCLFELGLELFFALLSVFLSVSKWQKRRAALMS